MSKPVLKLKKYGPYKHKFESNYNHGLIDSYYCVKCGAKSAFDGWSLKRIYLFKLKQYKSDWSEKDKFKSSLKVIERKNNRYDTPSYAILWKRGDECYRINPFTGKILTKRGCRYSADEMMIKDIL